MKKQNFVADRAKVQDLKTIARTSARVDFFKGCPKQYDSLLTMIDKLTFDSTPPYEALLKLLLEVSGENAGLFLRSKHILQRVLFFSVAQKTA